MHYITLRALAAQVLLLMQVAIHAQADELSPTTTTTITTSTTVVATNWVVITSISGALTTYTTTGTVNGSTIGVTTVVGSHVKPSKTTEPSTQPPKATSTNMAWEGQPFKDAVLNSTNYYRTQHEANALTWDGKLASYAQDHAKKCDFAHSEGSYGENLAQGYASPTLVIDSWAGEESNYDYEKQQFSTDNGHFTQLVWKNSTAVGCGASDCGGSGWLLVCEYNPAGNMIGDFGRNVGKAGQGEDGEPGLGGVAGRSVGTKLLVALVAASVFAGMYV